MEEENKKAIQKAINFDNEFLDVDLEDLPEVNPGDRVSIFWKDIDYSREYPDKGYAMTTPDMFDVDCGNIIIHIPNPTNSVFDFMDDLPEVYTHLLDLYTNDNVDKIEVTSSIR